MNLPTFMREKSCINKFCTLLVLNLLVGEVLQAWTIDLSRRRKDITRREASVQTESSPGVVTEILSHVVTSQPKQEIVILNTAKGFVPDTLRLVQGHRYQLHVVNINKDHKNLSFIMDYFGEHHGSFYGEQKSFSVQVDKPGIFSYQCPELGFEGRMVVSAAAQPQKPGPIPLSEPMPNSIGNKTLRGLASETP